MDLAMSKSDISTTDALTTNAEEVPSDERAEVRLAAKTRRREMRRKAEAHDALLLQRDALASRGLRLSGKGLDLVEAIENLFSAMNENVDAEIRNGLRFKVGNAIDDFVYLIDGGEA